MSFNILETSIFGGSPIELYEFTIAGQSWRYTTDDRPTVFNLATYEPMSELKRGRIRLTQSIERSELRLNVRGNSGIADEFRVSPPSSPITLTIYKKHRGDSDYIVRWKGRVKDCVWEGNLATLVCVRVNSTMTQPGLRRSFQYACPYGLFDTACGVARASHELIVPVTAMSGLTLSVTLPSAFSVDYFAGGYILWENDAGRQDTRMVTTSTGSTVTVQNSLIGLYVGANVRLYPGCDHTITTCHSKYANADNFGGFPFIPSVNPFGGTTIF